MKFICLKLFLLFIYFPNNTIAQTYQPFPPDSAEWSVLTYIGSTAEQHFFETIHYGISGDTIIDANTYHKIVSNTQANFDISDSDNLYAGAFREENKIIYFLDSESATEDTLYNFNLSIGSFMPPVFENQTSISDSIVLIDSLELTGTYHKKYETIFDSTNTFLGIFSNSLIEGLGALAGARVFPPVDSNDPYQNILLCFTKDDEIIYLNDELNTCHYSPSSSVDEPFRINEIVNIFPNPCKEVFTVQVNNNSAASITLKSLNGKTILSQNKLKNGSTHFDVSHLPSGVYFVELRLINDIITHKIIKI